MTKRFLACAALAFALASTACQAPVQQAAVGLSDADEAAIRAVIEENRQAGLAADWDTFLTPFTDDAFILWPNQPAVVGIDAIRAVTWYRAIESEKTPIDIIGVGDLAYVRGSYTLLLDFEGAVRDEGKFLDVLRKQPDGSWYFAAWMNNSDLPVEGGEPG